MSLPLRQTGVDHLADIAQWDGGGIVDERLMAMLEIEAQRGLRSAIGASFAAGRERGRTDAREARALIERFALTVDSKGLTGDDARAMAAVARSWLDAHPEGQKT